MARLSKAPDASRKPGHYHHGEASTTTAVPGQMLSEFAITVDGGTHYIGEIRNVRKR